MGSIHPLDQIGIAMRICASGLNDRLPDAVPGNNGSRPMG